MKLFSEASQRRVFHKQTKNHRYRKARFETLETKAAPSGSLAALLGAAMIGDITDLGGGCNDPC